MKCIILEFDASNADEVAFVNAAMALGSNGGSTATPVTTAATEAPAVMVQSASADDTTGELDAFGVKYDPEIHTSTRAKNADGGWKARRGKTEEAKAVKQEAVATDGATEEAPEKENPNPEPPAELIDMPTLFGRFTQLKDLGIVSLDADAPNSYLVLYRDAGIGNGSTLENCETDRRKLYDFMGTKLPA